MAVTDRLYLTHRIKDPARTELGKNGMSSGVEIGMYLFKKAKLLHVLSPAKPNCLLMQALMSARMSVRVPYTKTKAEWDSWIYCSHEFQIIIGESNRGQINDTSFWILFPIFFFKKPYHSPTRQRFFETNIEKSLSNKSIVYSPSAT
jgi:hypothetical protein